MGGPRERVTETNDRLSVQAIAHVTETRTVREREGLMRERGRRKREGKRRCEERMEQPSCLSSVTNDTRMRLKCLSERDETFHVSVCGDDACTLRAKT